MMNLSPVGKRDTLKACLQAAQLAAEKERERCEAREATADFAALPPSAQELQKVEWELQDLLADGERGDTLDSHDALRLVGLRCSLPSAISVFWLPKRRWSSFWIVRYDVPAMPRLYA